MDYALCTVPDLCTPLTCQEHGHLYFAITVLNLCCPVQALVVLQCCPLLRSTKKLYNYLEKIISDERIEKDNAGVQLNQ